VIREYRSTRGVSDNHVGNTSIGNGRNVSRSKAKSCPTVWVRFSMRR